MGTSRQWRLLDAAVICCIVAVELLPVGKAEPWGTWGWTDEQTPDKNNLNDVFMLDSITGWAVGDYDGTLRTVDGGATWALQITDLGNINQGYGYIVYHWEGVTAKSASEVWIVGTNAKIMKSEDGGLSWTEQASNVGNYITIFDVQYVSESTLYAVGSHGTVLKTTNGGETWGPANSKPQVDGVNVANSGGSFYDLHFVDVNTGWLVGQVGRALVHHTKDGGNSWIEQYPFNITFNSLSGVFFDGQLGWAVGSQVRSPEIDPESKEWIYNEVTHEWSFDYRPVPEGSYGVMHTHNGGTNWTLLTACTLEDLHGISMDVPSGHGYAVGKGGEICWNFAGLEGGGEWTANLRRESDTIGFNAVVQWGDALMRIVGVPTLLPPPHLPPSTSTLLLRLPPPLHPPPPTPPPPRPAPLQARPHRLLHRCRPPLPPPPISPPPPTWFYTRPSPSQSTLRALALTTDRQGLIVGDFDTILRTEDKGETWVAIKSNVPLFCGTCVRYSWFSVSFRSPGAPSPPPPQISGWPQPCDPLRALPLGGPVGCGLCFPAYDGVVGWIVGSYGAAMITRDGGLTWNLQQTGLTPEVFLQAVMCVAHDTVVAVGTADTIIRTRDAGATWEPLPASTYGMDFNAVAFINATMGWVVGNHGNGRQRILVTRDGGDTWTFQYFSPAVSLYGVTILPEDLFDNTTNSTIENYLGWAVGDNGTIMHTEDGGLHWNSIQSCTTQRLQAIKVDQSDRFAFVVGEEGAICQSNDGGHTWHSIGETDDSELTLRALAPWGAQQGWFIWLTFGGVGTVAASSLGLVLYWQYGQALVAQMTDDGASGPSPATKVAPLPSPTRPPANPSSALMSPGDEGVSYT
ncbi:hypothetical protein CYMTET_39707 [Cymbomonas tetramitiformis]|uniref:Photosynthesis system II assembly factor Ycf48/Hcf136-like domain-containing protein n=1 Tax=Cymbomonas tetramitiformis TaxID=36881 RepID=A0AAE0CBA0_9CHLO|nr:hypothetical protein CYMTET_39707 [Cymbomonas tetramitiformis]